MIGALMLARAVEDPSLSEEILLPRRETLLGKAQPSSQSDNRLTPPGRSLRQRLPHGLTRALPLPICGDIGSLCAAEISNCA
jgi:hypothetical protein